MRKAAMLCLFTLLATAMALAQNTASGNSSATPQAQASPAQSNPNAPSPSMPAGSAQGEASQNNTAQPAQTTPPLSPPTGQSSPATATGQQIPSNSSTNDQVAAGTEIHAALDAPLSTKTSKPGDRFTATISDPVRGAAGSVVIPAGARVEGEVAESEQGKAVAALRGKGKLSLRFRDLVLPNGQSLPLTATLVSVNSTNGKNTRKADEEGQVQSGTRGRDVAKDVGIGAGAGTIAGLIFGAPLKGLAIGALAGGGYVLATKGKEVDLPAQTGMVIRLDQPVSAAGSAP